MNIIETTFEKLPTKCLLIGFEGENLRATVRIDCASVFAEYPNATPTLIVKPLFADAYPVVVDRNGTDVDWLITSEILSFSGDGEIQLVFYKDQVICKSAVSKIRVSRSLTVTGEMPDPVVQWIENANRKLAEVDAQIVELEGMVDTATDAATRAEQSASTASIKAEQAAGSAATATEKATEATNAAGTATAKAAEAEQSALTATEKANAAAESERIATAKAGEATTAAGTATAKAEQATEAAQTATEKAGDASASARAAHASEINAAESADDALSAEVGANAAKRAAETSATQASISEQNAGTAAQTATQKATEAQQSATDAATFAGTATTKAEEAAESAQAASDAKTAVEETAEQLAESLEQIEQNTQDIAELDERKANIDGYYPDMTVGNAEQLNSSKFVENSEPYTLRTSGGSSDIGNREYLDAVVGGTLAWNQMVRDEASENSTDFAPIVTVTDAVEDAAGVRVKLEPVQDLHGYDHPWPAGGGKNLLPYATIESPLTKQGITFVRNQDGSIAVNGTSTVSFSQTFVEFALEPGNYYFNCGNDFSLQPSTYVYIRDVDNSRTLAEINSSSIGVDKPFSIDVQTNVRFYMVFGTTGLVISGTLYPMIRLASETDATFAPYENICPITGWDGVKVTRTGKNLLNSNLSEWNTKQSYRYINDVVPKGATARLTFTDKDKSVNTSDIYFGWVRENLAEHSGSPSFYNWVVQNGSIRSDTTNRSTNSNISALCTNLFIYPNTEDVFNRLFARYDIMAEFSSTATDYEPYQGNTYDIALPTEAGTVYGGSLSIAEDGSGVLTVTHKSVTYTGASSEDWSVAIDTGLYRFQIVPNDINNISNISKAIVISNIGIPTTDKIIASIKQYQNRVWYFAPSGITTVEQFRTWLASNNMQVVYELATPITYNTLTPTEIRTLLGQNNIWSDAGQTALTYTGTDEHLTLESGKKYLSRISGTDSMLLGSGQEITAAKGADNVFDLTQMFGTAVADYVYGQGAAFFRKWFGKTRYPYNAGELRHVEGLSAHEMVGFNQWDEDWEVGRISTTTGTNTQATGIRSKNFIPVLPLTAYFLKSSRRFYVIEYDANKNYVRYAGNFMNEQYTTSANAHYIRFYNVDVTTYSGDICINLVHNGSRNGEYEPYEKHSYPLDSTVILRGIPKVGANGVYWDGDRYLPDGTVERKYGVVDLGTVNWLYRNSLFDGSLPNGKLTSTREGGILAVCSKYAVFPLHWSSLTDGQACVGGGYVNSSTCSIVVKDSAYTDAAAFKAAMSGVYLVYELATPTTETAQPYHSTQWVSDWGTEEFVSTGLVPVGHETRYPANLRDKLQHLPDAASGNGSYLITQTDGQMVLTPFPAPPSTAGNYVLKATVVNGVATYTWEVAT